ncbi:hypothetical protein EVAR_727_1 [Eumeta japonica]|uniref:Uncharacterized protein n=1 Tax=Eumeta variegata TaxID=151549 RepID=A0A4C1SEQ0_EUMVA|nr:hypothetical protein EVAR_727_1 [Eumeta japonica]
MMTSRFLSPVRGRAGQGRHRSLVGLRAYARGINLIGAPRGHSLSAPRGERIIFQRDKKMPKIPVIYTQATPLSSAVEGATVEEGDL